MNHLCANKHACGLTQRIIHVHPGLGCNLSCRHCYSSSGPASKVRLDTDVVCQALNDAANLGYDVAAFSGGEPTMHPGLLQMLQTARASGLRTTVTTNGTLLTDRIISDLEECVDLLAISLDGPPEVHNQMRGSETTFSRMMEGLNRLKQSRIPYGFIFTLTQTSWEHLVWAGEFAVEHGGQLLQVHPLEQMGRGASLIQLSPDTDILAKAYLLGLALQARFNNVLRVQIDLFNREHLLQYPNAVYAAGGISGRTSVPADRLNLIVLEADGSVVPFAYGLSHEYAIANVREQRLEHAFPIYLETRYPRLLELCYRVFQDQVVATDSPLLNWYEAVVRTSHSSRLGNVAGSADTNLTVNPQVNFS